MEWRYPWMFLFIAIWIAIILFSSLKGSKSSLFYNAISKQLKDNLFNRTHWNRVILRRRLQSVGIVFLIIAAAGPQVGTKVKPVERKGVDLVFAIDVSISMDAIDVKPSRLEKAKFEISQLVNQLKGDRVGIIVFAGTSHLYLPLTTDYEAVLLFLDVIDTAMIPTQGTSLKSALSTAISVFPEENKKHKVVILVTDGEDHEGDAVAFAEKASDTGIIIHSVGVGTYTGSLIPVGNEDDIINYKRDLQGNLVTSVLNESALSDVANAGDGIFIRFDNQASSYLNLLRVINMMEKKTISTHEFSEYKDQYHIFAFITLLCFIFPFFISTKNTRDLDTWRGRFV